MADRDFFPELRLAVVGAGRWGQNLVRVVRELPGVSLALVCDLDPRRLEGPARAGIRVTQSADLVFGAPDVDGVLLATPAGEHARMAVSALSAGKHVFVEKPLALHPGEARKVARAAAAASRVVLVGHIVHYDPAYAALHALVARGAIGHVRKLYAIRHAESVRGDSGAFWALGPHDISFALRCSGAFPDHVTAHRTSTERTVARLEFPGSSVAVVDVWGAAPKGARVFVAVGEGAAVVDATSSRSVLRVMDARSAIHLSGVGTEGEDRGELDGIIEAVAALSTEVAPVPLSWVEPLKAEVQAFVSAITRGEAYPTTLEDGIDVTRVMAAVDATPTGIPNRVASRRSEDPSPRTFPAVP